MPITEVRCCVRRLPRLFFPFFQPKTLNPQPGLISRVAPCPSTCRAKVQSPRESSKTGPFRSFTQQSRVANLYAGIFSLPRCPLCDINVSQPLKTKRFSVLKTFKKT